MSTDQTAPAAGLPSADVATVRHRVATILHHESRSASGFAQHTTRPQDTADYTVIAALFEHFTLGLLGNKYDGLIHKLINTDTDDGSHGMDGTPCDHGEDRTCVACDGADYCPAHEVKLNGDGTCDECDRLDTKRAAR